MTEERAARYHRCRERILALCEGVSDEIALMASFVGVLHNEMPEFYWTGFYRVVDGKLLIGPYQGTVGCLGIELGRGVCGVAARTGETQIVDDVHLFPGHIACDERSQSEIVVPVRNQEGVLIAVLDIDSIETHTFDEGDGEQLEELLATTFGR